MQIYDCHVHTAFSHDGKASLEQQCQKAKELGLSGITITDHNYPPPKGLSFAENIRKSVEEANRLKDRVGESIQILSGVEMADLFLGGCDAAPFYAIQDIDCILGSVHSKAIIRRYFPDAPVSTLLGTCHRIDLDFARRFTQQYLLEVLKTAEEGDVDVIAHLSYPLRYINGEGNIGLQISEFYPTIDEIFEAMIKRGLALEVNTSGLSRGWNEFMPQESVLERYYKKGGRYITTGSDAHKTEQLAVGICEAQDVLKRIGFTHGSYFVGRKRQDYKL